MTTFERFEREIPELMTELAPARVPDYFDDMLQMTAGTRQRPAWSALERWLPMGEIALPAPTRHVPWRAVALLTAALLIVAASLVVVGSRRPALPPPFGPAANGVIVYGTADGDIAAYDPVSDVTTTLVGGAAVEQYPIISNDGTRLSFARTPTGGGAEADFTASMDGSDIRDFLPSGPTISWWDESASGDRVILSRVVDGVTTLSIVDFATGRETPIAVDLALGIKIAMHRPGHDEIVYEHVPADGQPGTTVYVGPGDGAGPLRPVAISPDAANEAWPSPDGSKLVYTTWGTDEAQHGRIRVVDMDSGTDTPLHFEGSEGTIELAPQFSPDGKRLALRRFTDRWRRPGRHRAGRRDRRDRRDRADPRPGRRHPVVAGRRGPRRFV